MIENESEGLFYYQFKNIANDGIFHGVFSREGGVSPEPWDSLNLGGTVGDSPANVRENLSRLVSVSGFSPQQLVQVRQIHSAKVIQVNFPQDAIQEGDAIMTDKNDLLLLMRYADCVPVHFFDPENRAIAIAHAGWKGTLNGVVAEVIQAMTTHYGSSPDQIRVGIGPSIGPDHYLVGDDVIQKTKTAFPDDYEGLLRTDSDGTTLDLWKANQIHLEKMGVIQIETAGICTGCEPAKWYSHRIEKGRTGRFAAVIGMK